MNKRIAIAVEENGFEERIAEHFGRCTKFNVCEIDLLGSIHEKESFFNPLVGEHSGVCQLPGYIKQFNINTIIAGGMGQKAISNFHSLGIEVITAPGMFYEEALALYLEGKLTGYQTCTHDHNH